MGPTLTRGDASRADAMSSFEAEGCGDARWWANGPGDAYEAHEHPRDKVLYCLEGSILFTTDAGDLDLAAGDRLDLPAGTRHGARVGPTGCACVEAWGP